MVKGRDPDVGGWLQQGLFLVRTTFCSEFYSYIISH